jgi:hypothetical protein
MALRENGWAGLHLLVGLKDQPMASEACRAEALVELLGGFHIQPGDGIVCTDIARAIVEPAFVNARREEWVVLGVFARSAAGREEDCSDAQRAG